MSETNEKMTFGKIERRQARSRQEETKKKRVRLISILVIVALAIAFSGALFLNSNYIRRNFPAVTVGGRDFTAAEFDFFFIHAYFDYQQAVVDQMGGFVPGMMPEPGWPLRSQIQNHTTGETWADFFNDLTITQIAELVELYSAAMDYGYVLRDGSRAVMDEEIEMLMMMAEWEGISFTAHLRNIYGRSVNERVFREMSEFMFTANSFNEYMWDTFAYTPEALSEFYEENIDMFDNFTYRIFLFRAETVNMVDFESTEEFEEAREQALESARVQAAAIAAGIETEEDFIAAASAFDDIEFGEPDSTLRVFPGEWLGGVYGPWMRDPSRTFGDITTEDIPTGTHVIFFINRDSNEYRMVDMRQILFSREQSMFIDFDDIEDDDARQEAMDMFQQMEMQAEMDVRLRAEAVYNLFVEGGATEELLLELMAEHSDDHTEGGLYTDISKVITQNKLVPEIEEWLFAPGRDIGDFALIRTEDFGYHLVFFTGFGESYRDFIADARMRDRDHAEWFENLEPVGNARRWAFFLTSQ
ncbi:MAG: hypothetical protein FWC90_06185 [Oscillospiraceae bacterium]|nr:hypothetical protein [Oscillospiraceae bacterium]